MVGVLTRLRGGGGMTLGFSASTTASSDMSRARSPESVRYHTPNATPKVLRRNGITSVIGALRSTTIAIDTSVPLPILNGGPSEVDHAKPLGVDAFSFRFARTSNTGPDPTSFLAIASLRSCDITYSEVAAKSLRWATSASMNPYSSRLTSVGDTSVGIPGWIRLPTSALTNATTVTVA